MSERKNKKKPASRGSSSPASTGTAGSPMDVALLQQIVKLMAANDLNTVDVRDGDRRVILKRGAVMAMTQAMPAPAPVTQAPAAAPQAASGGTSAPAEDDTKGLVPIKSPMVGTFYASPKPGEKAFVGVGSTVNEESDVCIIEAMKTFNVHKAGVSGTIAKVLVQDGQTVQYDQTLFLVKP